jgi:hypothetical protein
MKRFWFLFRTAAIVVVVIVFFSLFYCGLGQSETLVATWNAVFSRNITSMPCGTTEFYRMKALKRGFGSFGDSCMQGNCDKPAIRNAAKTDLKTVNLIVHVFNDDDGHAPDGNFRSHFL